MDRLWTEPIPEQPWVNTSLYVRPISITLREVLKYSSTEHWDRDSLGERVKLPDGKLGEYEYIKYKDLYLSLIHI